MVKCVCAAVVPDIFDFVRVVILSTSANTVTIAAASRFLVIVMIVADAMLPRTAFVPRSGVVSKLAGDHNPPKDTAVSGRRPTSYTLSLTVYEDVPAPRPEKPTLSPSFAGLQLRGNPLSFAFVTPYNVARTVPVVGVSESMLCYGPSISRSCLPFQALEKATPAPLCAGLGFRRHAGLGSSRNDRGLKSLK